MESRADNSRGPGESCGVGGIGRRSRVSVGVGKQQVYWSIAHLVDICTWVEAAEAGQAGRVGGGEFRGAVEARVGRGVFGVVQLSYLCR